MSIFYSCIQFIFAGIVLAAEPMINLNIQLSLDDKLLSQPNLTTLSGQSASIESVNQEGYGFFVEVTPTLQDNSQVQIKFILFKIEKFSRTLLSKPQVITILGRSASIQQEMQGEAKQKIFLSVTPSVKKQ